MSARTFFASPLPAGFSALRCASAFKDQPYTLFFDSADAGHALSRYSYVAFSPMETISAKDGVIDIVNAEQRLSVRGDAMRMAQVRMDLWTPGWKSDESLPPFQGGIAGYFGYDLARQIEDLPRIGQGRATPDMMIGLYDQVAAFDHKTGKGWFITHAQDMAQAKERLHAFTAAVERVQEQEAAYAEISFTPLKSRGEYERDVRRVIDYIYAGDIFQANLSQCFEGDLPRGFDAFAHYCHLREISPAPYAAYMNFGDVQIASASPERFLHVKDGQVDTRPIKGTRPRGITPAQDWAMIDDLTASEKDRAENAMIVDLLRNDISKVCEDHSVKVPQLCGLESFANVHHLVSIVTGTLRADKGAADLLRACFPGGSITGAPKVRAMEIIEELEPTARGPYCGSLGYIGHNGAMETSITIRTLIYEGGVARFNVGGGIVADSNPAQEYEETLHKAAGILRSFEAPQDERERKAA